MPTYNEKPDAYFVFLLRIYHNVAAMMEYGRRQQEPVPGIRLLSYDAF